MKIFLLANQPDKTTRLKLFEKSLSELGHEVIVPKFSSSSWLIVAHEAKQQIKQTKPDIVHIFNVPDVIYKGIPTLKGKYFKKLYYDYRSPWGIELSEYTGWCGRAFGEHHERYLVRHADKITTVNSPLANKAVSYKKYTWNPINYEAPRIIPNYPEKEFSKRCYIKSRYNISVLYIGRTSKLEGAHNLNKIAKEIYPYLLCVIGSGPYKIASSDNIAQFGWVDHDQLPEFISGAHVCIVPRDITRLTSYATDKSVWKVNEYLNAGKVVVASGIIKESDRRNLHVVHPDDLPDTIIEMLNQKPEPLLESDYYYWEDNKETTKGVYEI